MFQWSKNLKFCIYSSFAQPFIALLPWCQLFILVTDNQKQQRGKKKKIVQTGKILSLKKSVELNSDKKHTESVILLNIDNTDK